MRGKFRRSGRIYLDNSEGFGTLPSPGNWIFAYICILVGHPPLSMTKKAACSNLLILLQESVLIMKPTHTNFYLSLMSVTFFDTSYGGLISPSQKSQKSDDQSRSLVATEVFRGHSTSSEPRTPQTPRTPRTPRWLGTVYPSTIWGYPNSWMVYFMENPIKVDDDWG